MRLRALPILTALLFIHAGTSFAEPVTDEVRFSGCTMHYGEVPLARSEADALMPEGFTPTGGLLGFGGPAVANLFVLSQRCSVTTGDGHTNEDYHDILHGIYVFPPPDLDTPAVDAVLTGLMTSDPHVAAVYESWGLVPDADGTVLIETVAPASMPLVGVSNGDGPFGLVIQQNVPPTRHDFPGLEFRVWVPDEHGGIGAVAEYDMSPGDRWGLGEVEASFSHGTPFTPITAAGIGSMFTWSNGQPTQTFVPVAAPATD